MTKHRKLAFLSATFLALMVVSLVTHTHRAAAIAVPDQGNLLADQILLDANSEGTGSTGIANIQSFLTSEGGYLATYQSLFDCRAYLPDGSYFLGNASSQAYAAISAPCGQTVSAATIIYYTSQVYGVSPKVVMATLQKESSLITAGSQNANLINTAMGYNCPDSTGCSTTSGSNFMYQLDGGAWVLRYRYERLNGNTSYWPAVNSSACTGTTRYYSPSLYPNQQVKFYDDSGVNYATINLQTAATGSLYCYTPHVYNNPQGLNGLPQYGTTGQYYSGSYNFYAVYNAWFGSPAFVIGTNTGAAYISALGRPVTNEICGIKNNGCYQFFDNGSIYWSQATGAHRIWGGIRAKWGSTGSEWGPLGLPISDELYGNKGGGAYQDFENGRIYYTSSGASYFILNQIIDRWNQSNAEWGYLGYPKNDTVCGTRDNGCYQIFQNNVMVYWSQNSGAHTIAGGIKAKWASVGNEWSSLGFPVSDELYGNKGGGAYQDFENGRIYYTSSGTSYIILNQIIDRWNQSNAEWGVLGYPKTDTICGIANNGCYQIFQNNIMVYWSQATGAHTIAGGILAEWSSTGSEWGPLGLPTSDEQYDANGAFQTFEHGTIHYPYNGTPASIVYS